MNKKQKSKESLADKIANILVSAPTSEDPEDVTDETKAQVCQYSEDDENEDDELISKFRKQNIDLLEDLDERYAGKKASRRDLIDSDEFSEDNDLQQNSEVQSASSDEEEEEDSEENEESDGSEVMGESEVGSLEGDVDVKPMKESDTSSQVQKGLCVRNQLSMWERLLEIRIQLQKCLLAANKMPNHKKFKEIKAQSGTEFTNNATEIRNSVANALDKMLLLQQLVQNDYPETKNLHRNKKEEVEDEEIASDTEEENSDVEDEDPEAEPQKKRKKVADYEKEISRKHEMYKEYRNGVIQKWHDKTRIAAVKNITPQHSIINHIEHTLSDRSKLVKRTQLKRSEYKIIGEEETVQPAVNDSKEVKHVEEYNTEIFDDDDFYHQLLRELIEMKSADVTDPVQLGRQWIQLQNLRSKMKRKVDTRASKGRKIRYAVHSKLVNFMAPIDESTWTDGAKTELYNSLFGKNQLVVSS